MKVGYHHAIRILYDEYKRRKDNSESYETLQSIKEGIEYMSKSTSVEDWNNRREDVKEHLNIKEVIKHIDASGLIVKVLGKDKPEDYPIN